MRNYKSGIDIASFGNFCQISPRFRGQPLDPGGGSGYHGDETALPADCLVYVAPGMSSSFPKTRLVWETLCKVASELFWGAYNWATQANWTYPRESASENAVGTVVSLFGIAITLTLALGAAVWGTAATKYVTDDKGKISRSTEVTVDDETSLKRKLYVYDALSAATLFALFWIIRMKSTAAVAKSQRVHRFDRATIHYAVGMMIASALVVGGASWLVWGGNFPGQLGPAKVVVRPYRFVTDKTEGFRVIVPYYVSKADDHQARTTITVAPEINRNWEIAGVEGYRPATPPIPLKNWDDPAYQPPKDLKLTEGPYIQEDGGPAVNTSELVLFDVEAGTEYTLVFRFHPRNGATARVDDALKFLQENPATGFKVK